MFTLNEQQAKLHSVNARAERHGDECVPAFDLKFHVLCGNGMLHFFHDGLRQALFTHPDLPDLAEQGADTAPSALRFPLMGALKWDMTQEGCTLTIGYGLGGKSDIVLAGCEVDQFTIKPLQGGSVDIGFRVICHPDSEDVGRICEFIQGDATLTLTAPAEVPQEEPA